MKVNIGKTKWMISGNNGSVKETSGRWPCAVCKKGVGRNSLQCTGCQKWVHSKCSGVKGSLSRFSVNFKCKVCMGNIQDAIHSSESKVLDLGDGMSIEEVGSFCYLGDTISKQGGAGEAVTARVRSGWKKFKELAPFLTDKHTSMTVRGQVYDACVRSAMLYGSETWPVKVEDENKIQRNDRKMIRWICGVKISDRLASAELIKKLGIEDIKVLLRRRRLRWAGHVERKDGSDWVKKCVDFNVDGCRQKGRPRKSWMEVVCRDMKSLGLRKEDTLFRGRWRARINEGRLFAQKRLTQVDLEK